jgi:methionyl-tRNA synthetase
MISYEDFSKLEMKIGKVLEVEDHPNADKLYVLKVNIGDKEIQLVAGLKNHYSAEDLKGKNVVVLTNLEPRQLRGVESQGMVLAAQSNDKVCVIGPLDEIEPGSVIR